ncbi:MAG: hypothetical protein NTU94_01325 [Planctomycetota bacterium]|nr:hypothetical protein [Planctomycetota bacterium]
MAVRGPLAMLLLAGAVLAAGCSSAPPPQATGRTVVRPALGFALDVPEGWTWRDLGGDVALEIIEQAPAKADTSAAAAKEARIQKRGGPVAHVVVVDREGMTLEAWADQAIKDSQQFQSDLEASPPEKARLADGREALAVTLKNPRGLRPLVQKMLLATTKHRAYSLMLTAPEPDRAAAEKTFKKSFDTFVVW